MFIMWILLEINMLTFIIMMYFKMKDDQSSKTYPSMFYYFTMQSLASMFFLISANSMILNTDYTMMSIIMTTSIMFKVGMFPFQFWSFKIMVNLSMTIFLTLVSLQKIPTFLIMFSLKTNFLTLILLMNLIIGVMLMINVKSMKELIMSSSIYTTFWVLNLLYMGSLMFILYMTSYMMSLSWLINITNNSSKINYKNMLSMMMLMMFFLGLPPLNMFFMKLFFINFFYDMMKNYMILFVMVWLISFFANVSYVKFFYKHMMIKEYMYLNKNNVKILSNMIYFSILSLMGFLI